MTYRLDSDMKQAYGFFSVVKPLPKKQHLPQYIKKFGASHTHLAANKTKLVAWLVSNCHSSSAREAYVNELKKHIDVDVYGRCGKNTCPHSKERDCMSFIEKDYKFYLSFENSLSLDYITEKLFKVMKINVVPITFSWGQRFPLPVNSTIDALSYLNPKV